MGLDMYLKKRIKNGDYDRESHIGEKPTRLENGSRII